LTDERRTLPCQPSVCYWKFIQIKYSCLMLNSYRMIVVSCVVKWQNCDNIRSKIVPFSQFCEILFNLHARKQRSTKIKCTKWNYYRCGLLKPIVSFSHSHSVFLHEEKKSLFL
jgi:hypothetical protein